MLNLSYGGSGVDNEIMPARATAGVLFTDRKRSVDFSNVDYMNGAISDRLLGRNRAGRDALEGDVKDEVFFDEWSDSQTAQIIESVLTPAFCARSDR